jgi:glycosyltransferase involved in cell wall biosynthesis
MACWLPIIIKEQWTTRPYLENGNWLLLRKGDVYDIKEKILKIHKEDIINLWKKSRELAEKKYSREIINKRFIS